MPVPPIGIDPAGVMSARVGDAGLGRSTWRELRPRGVSAVRELQGAAEAGLVPHLVHSGDARLGTAVGKLVRAWKGVERLAILGDAGAVAGATVLGAPRDTLLLTDPADASCADLRGVGLIVLGSAPWVVACRGPLGAVAEQTWQVDGDGTTETTPRRKGQRRLAVTGGADLRFITASPVALALATLAGADTAELVETLHTVGEATLTRVRADNPALALAQLATGLVEGPARGAPALLVPAGLVSTARHAARIWQSFTTRPRPDGGARRLPCGVPLVLTRGDEAAAAALLTGPSDLWALQVVGGGGVANVLDSAWKRALLEAGTPVVQLRGAGDSPARRLALIAVVTQAAVLTALHLGLEPLALPGADRLREVQRAQGLDSP